MLAVIIINVLLVTFVLVAIVGSHVWAIVSSREAQAQPSAQPAAVSPARAGGRRRQPQAAPTLSGAGATR